MSLRRFASLSSGLAVAIVAATGIVSFLAANRGWALEVHTLVGFAFVALVSLHIADGRYVVLGLAGHGHVTGRDGAIDPDVSHMTTGLQIVDRVLIEVDPQKGPSRGPAQPRGN